MADPLFKLLAGFISESPQHFCQVLDLWAPCDERVVWEIGDLCVLSDSARPTMTAQVMGVSVLKNVVSRVELG